MTVITEELVIEERISRVDELDLEPIVYKLMHPEPDAAALAMADADRDVELYRCFWKLCVLYPATTIVPTLQIDRVWHAHILDTVQYRVDCERVFGGPLHHFPYAGLRGADDRQAWRADFARTCALFAEHFGVDVGTVPAGSACSNHGDGTDCCVGCVRPSATRGRPRPARRVQPG